MKGIHPPTRYSTSTARYTKQRLLAIDYMDVVKGVRSFGCLRAAYLQPHALLWHDVAYNWNRPTHFCYEQLGRSPTVWKPRNLSRKLAQISYTECFAFHNRYFKQFWSNFNFLNSFYSWEYVPQFWCKILITNTADKFNQNLVAKINLIIIDNCVWEIITWKGIR